MYDPEEFTVVLRGCNNQSVFVIPTGYVEASWIRFISRQTPYPSPPTHAFILSIIRALDGVPIEVVVHGYNMITNVYECYLAVRKGENVIKVGCRVTDALAISLVAAIPLKVNTAFLGRVVGVGGVGVDS